LLVFYKEDLDKRQLKSAYRGRKVLVTGHTGFKGSWLCIWLRELGAEVTGYALDPRTTRDNFVLTGLSDKIRDVRGDIRDLDGLLRIFREEKPEIVFHLAAQALVFESYGNPLETLHTNVLGTAHVLEAIRQTPSVQTGIMITSDKCYENREVIWGYREEDPMGGHDPYSASKGSAELVIHSYQQSYFKNSGQSIASVRAGNVIGGGDWSGYRLIPDVVRALESNKVVELRNPRATRPWQHVLQPLEGYLQLAAKMMDHPGEFAESWNFGPFPHEVEPVQSVVDKMIRHFGKGQWRDVSENQSLHEANLLTLDITKALSRLGWKPLLSLDDIVHLTAGWYKNYRNHIDMYEFCKDQIHGYMERLDD